MKSQSFNIALLPDLKTEQEAIELSKKISKTLETEFVLDGINLYPHITVYQAHYPLKNLDLLKQKIKELAKLSPETISVAKLEVAYETFVFWTCLKDDSLKRLHDRAVEEANPLREGLTIPGLPSISFEDEYDIKHFGSLLIGPRYFPHITLTRLTSPGGKQEVKRILSESQSTTFKPRSLVLGDLGDHGTVTKIIEEFPLK